jgi:hypothetical protein
MDPLVLSQPLIMRALREGWSVRYVAGQLEFFRDRQTLTPAEQRLMRQGQLSHHFLAGGMGP